MKLQFLIKISAFSALVLGLTTIINPLTTFAAVNSGEYSTQGVQTSTLATQSVNSVLGSYKTVRYLGGYNHTFTAKEKLRNDIVEQTIFLGLSGVSGGSAYLLSIAKRLNLYKTVDVVSLGGVYTDSYYVRKVVYPSQSNLNVPVLYKFEYWTIFYKNNNFRSTEIAYINKVGDGQRLDSN